MMKFVVLFKYCKGELKNNPVLIGEPGVGKTAIVEGLALRIVNNEVPEGLKNKRVLVLDMGALMLALNIEVNLKSGLRLF